MSQLHPLPITGALDAIQLIENCNPSQEDYIRAFQTLVDDGIVWRLQGWYGREADRLLAAGLITMNDG